MHPVQEHTNTLGINYSIQRLTEYMNMKVYASVCKNEYESVYTSMHKCHHQNGKAVSGKLVWTMVSPASKF